MAEPSVLDPSGMSMTGPATSPLRALLRTEAASASVLAAAIALALVWANVSSAGYDAFWTRELPIRIGPLSANLDLRTWVNSGLMAFFFLVVGLEARREFDLGELRDRRRMILPVAAGLAGMAVPVLIYLAFNHSGAGLHGWGAAMSTDTALALGVLAVAGRHVPDRVRTFLLTVFVVDDVVALLVIAIAYTSQVHVTGLLVAIAAYGGLLASTRLGYTYRRPVFTLLAVVLWCALLASALEEAKLGVLVAALGATVLTLAFYRVIALLSVRARTRALLGTGGQLNDLATEVDPERDHIRGPVDAAVTVVEYGDFECPWTQMAAPTARELLATNTHIRYVWRHLPLHDVHPHAQLAAEAAEAAGRQGEFWQMHDLLHQQPPPRRPAGPPDPDPGHPANVGYGNLMPNPGCSDSVTYPSASV